MLNIWRVMLVFLRRSWIVAEAGIGQAIIIVLVATSTISNKVMLKEEKLINNMISKSLAFRTGIRNGYRNHLANTVAVSLHTVGFDDSLNDLWASYRVTNVDDDPVIRHSHYLLRDTHRSWYISSSWLVWWVGGKCIIPIPSHYLGHRLFGIIWATN